MLRAQCYRLLARFLSSPPTAADLAAGARLSGDDSDLGRAISAFAHVCARSQAAAVAEEYHDLFIGLVRGELVPFGSYYLTGFLHEKPLAKLRQDMGRLGVEREQDVAEPEDHIASLCEMMAGFIDGSLGRTLSLEEQKAFLPRTSAVGRRCSSATWKRRKRPSSTPRSDRSAASSSRSRRARLPWSRARQGIRQQQTTSTWRSH